MRRLAFGMVLVAAATGALACGYRSEICPYVRQIERGNAEAGVRGLEGLANAGDVQAQLALGAFYATGRGIPQDDKAAFDWLMKAALAGSREAQALVGNLYAAGRGVPINLEEARRWYEIAAKRGDSDSQRMLGILYGRGEGAPLNYRDAYFWLALAAKSGDQEAVTYRDMVVPYLSPAELAEAQKAVAEWKPSDAQ